MRQKGQHFREIEDGRWELCSVLVLKCFSYGGGELTYNASKYIGFTDMSLGKEESDWSLL